MEFRWIALITLWTLVAGPIFDSPLNVASSRSNHTTSVAKHPVRK